MEKNLVVSAVETHLAHGNSEAFSKIIQDAVSEESADRLAEYASLSMNVLSKATISEVPKTNILDVLGFVSFAASMSFSFRVQKGKQYLQTATFPSLEAPVSTWHYFDPNKDTWVMPLPNHLIKWKNGNTPCYPECDSEQYSPANKLGLNKYPREELEWYQAEKRIKSLEALVGQGNIAENTESLRTRWNYGLRFQRMKQKTGEYFGKALVIPLLDEICSLLEKVKHYKGEKGSHEQIVGSFYCHLARERVIDLFEVAVTLGTQFQMLELNEDQIKFASDEIGTLKQRLLQISTSTKEKVSNTATLEVATSSIDIVSGLEGMFQKRLAEMKQSETLKKISSDLQDLRSEIRLATSYLHTIQVTQVFAHMHYMAGIRAIGELIDYQIGQSFFVSMKRPTFGNLLQNHLPRLQ